MLADVIEMRDSLVARPDFAACRQVGLDDLSHLLFDLRQIVRCERFVSREIVIEAVFDCRADGHLRAGEKVLHRHRQYVRGIVADQLQRFRILLRDDAKLCVCLDRSQQVPLPAIHLRGQRRLGKTRPDRRRHLCARDTAREIHRSPVGQ